MGYFFFFLAVFFLAVFFFLAGAFFVAFLLVVAISEAFLLEARGARAGTADSHRWRRFRPPGHVLWNPCSGKLYRKRRNRGDC